MARHLSIFPHTRKTSQLMACNHHPNAFVKKKCRVQSSLPSHILLTEQRAAKTMLLQGLSPLASSFHASHAL